MVPRNRGFEVVDHLRSARRPWTWHMLRFFRRTRLLALGIVPTIGFTRGDAESGNQQHDPMARQICKRIHLLATSEAERSTARQKKRDVRANVPGNIGELRRFDRHAPEVRQRHQGGRRIRAAAAKSRLQWNLFIELHDDVSNRAGSAKRSPQRLGSTPDQVRVIKWHTRGRAFEPKRTRSRNAAKRVVNRDRLEYSPKLVEAVSAHPQDAQIEVDLGMRADRD